MSCGLKRGELCLAAVASKAALILQEFQSMDRYCGVCQHSGVTIDAQYERQQSRSSEKAAKQH